ncbi:MAG: hypothetical protein ABJB86_04320 [Bacteroidota bacterium]
MSVLVEIPVYILLSHHMKYVVPTVYNIFSLVEFYLLIRMFYNWGVFRKKMTLNLIIVLAVVLFLSTLYINGYAMMNYFSLIVNSFALIFLSISAFNKMIINERNNIFKNAKFWICIGMIIFYTYDILVNTEQLSFLHIKRTKDFENKIWQINAYSNLLVNLLYAVAVIWIPRKKNIITLL